MVDLSGYAGKKIRLGFRHYKATSFSAGNGAGWYLDEVIIETGTIFSDGYSFTVPPGETRQLPSLTMGTNSTIELGIGSRLEVPLDSFFTGANVTVTLASNAELELSQETACPDCGGPVIVEQVGA